MYAVVNHLHLNGLIDDLLPSLEAEGAPLLDSQPGFRGFYFVREAEDRAIAIILWESHEYAERGAQAFGPTWFAQNVAPRLASPQQRSGGEVVVERIGLLE